jgi:hypothetical protein
MAGFFYKGCDNVDNLSATNSRSALKLWNFEPEFTKPLNAVYSQVRKEIPLYSLHFKLLISTKQKMFTLRETYNYLNLIQKSFLLFSSFLSRFHCTLQNSSSHSSLWYYTSSSTAIFDDVFSEFSYVRELIVGVITFLLSILELVTFKIIGADSRKVQKVDQWKERRTGDVKSYLW